MRTDQFKIASGQRCQKTIGWAREGVHGGLLTGRPVSDTSASANAMRYSRDRSCRSEVRTVLSGESVTSREYFTSAYARYHADAGSVSHFRHDNAGSNFWIRKWDRES